MIDPPIYPPNDAPAGNMWTEASVRERLVEAYGYLRRQPGGGPSPFATDGPWRRIVPDRADFMEQALAGEYRARPAALSPAEVSTMNATLAWVELLQADDARIVGVASDLMAGNGGKADWDRVARRLDLRTATGHRLGRKPTAMRYRRAIGRLVAELNGSRSADFRTFPGVKGDDLQST